MTPDSSVLVAAFAPWHETHAAARDALREVDELIAHAELETYSVLTRLPTPFRAPPSVVAAYLAESHPGDRLTLSRAARSRFVSELGEAGIAGGAVYDALVAATAREHGQQLVSCDRRAAPIYERIGADIVYIA